MFVHDEGYRPSRISSSSGGGGGGGG